MLMAFCLTFLVGAITGLRLNVKALGWLCLGALAVGVGATGLSIAPLSTIAALLVSCLIGLQVGYFATVVAQAIGVAHEPEAVRDVAVSRRNHSPIGSERTGH